MLTGLGRRQGINCTEANLEGLYLLLLELLHLAMESGMLTVPREGDR
jgi:hypothetical protein